MKKLAVITLLFALVLGAGIAESAWSRDYYSGVCDSLDKAYSALENAEEGSVSREAGIVLSDVITAFDDPLLAFVSNPNVTEKVSEYAAQALAFVRAGQNADARSAVLGAKRAAERLAREAVPLIANIL